MPSNKQFVAVPPFDPVLRQIAAEVPPAAITTPKIQRIIAAMQDYGRGQQGDPNRRVMVGLAAPQVGISLRIILVSLEDQGDGVGGQLVPFVNPRIVWRSQQQTENREGCFSIRPVAGVVDRPEQIKVEAYNRWGEPINGEYRGFTARIFLHEVDHLNGVLFFDHIEDDSKLHLVEDEEFGLYRRNWQHWQKRCSRQQLTSLLRQTP